MTRTEAENTLLETLESSAIREFRDWQTAQTFRYLGYRAFAHRKPLSFPGYAFTEYASKHETPSMFSKIGKLGNLRVVDLTTWDSA